MDRIGARGRADSIVSALLDGCIASGVVLDTLAQDFPPKDALMILEEICVISRELSLEAQQYKMMENSRN